MSRYISDKALLKFTKILIYNNDMEQGDDYVGIPIR